MADIFKFIEKLGGSLSHIHTTMSLLGIETGGKKADSTDVNTGLHADKHGKDQIDERLTLASFSRTMTRLVKEYGPDGTVTSGLIENEQDATNRIFNMLNIINSYSIEEIGKISLTFGMGQSKVEREIPQGKDSKDKEKPPVKKTVLENKDGQDMAIMICLQDDETFTKAFCNFAISSVHLWEEKLEKWRKHALAFLIKSDKMLAITFDELSKLLAKPFQEISLDNPDGIYNPPRWTNFIVFRNRTKVIEKCRQKYLEKLRLNQQINQGG